MFSAYLIRFVHLRQLLLLLVFIGTRIACIFGLIFDNYIVGMYKHLLPIAQS